MLAAIQGYICGMRADTVINLVLTAVTLLLLAWTLMSVISPIAVASSEKPQIRGELAGTDTTRCWTPFALRATTCDASMKVRNYGTIC